MNTPVKISPQLLEVFDSWGPSWEFQKRGRMGHMYLKNHPILRKGIVTKSVAIMALTMCIKRTIDNPHCQCSKGIASKLHSLSQGNFGKSRDWTRVAQMIVDKLTSPVQIDNQSDLNEILQESDELAFILNSKSKTYDNMSYETIVPLGSTVRIEDMKERIVPPAKVQEKSIASNVQDELKSRIEWEKRLTSSMGSQSPMGLQSQSPMGLQSQPSLAQVGQSPLVLQSQSPLGLQSQGGLIQSPLGLQSALGLQSQSSLAQAGQSPLGMQSQGTLVQAGQSPLGLQSQSPLGLQSQSPLGLQSQSPLGLQSQGTLVQAGQSPLGLQSQSSLAQVGQTPLGLQSQSPLGLQSQSPLGIQSQGALKSRFNSIASSSKAIKLTDILG